MSRQSIMDAIAHDYYKLADAASTPEQINALKQRIATSVQNGNLVAYEGIPLIQSLDAKLQAKQQDAALASGMIPEQPPIGKQILARNTPPQGIDSAESNLPQNYAGGGIVAFANPEGKQLVEAPPAMESFEDPSSGEVYQRPVPTTGGGILSSISSWADQLKAKAQGTYKTPPPAPVAPETPAEAVKKDTGIVIHDTPKRTTPASAAPAAETAPTSLGLDYLKELRSKNESNLNELKSLILGDQEERDRNRKVNTWLGVMKGGLEMLGGTSPWAGPNIGKGGAAAVEGIAQAQQQAQAEKARQVQQLVALGLKGQELETELTKLGITRDHYADLKRQIDAEAQYKNAMAAYVRGGKGGSSAGKGSVSSAVVQSELNNMEGYKANPASAPFFKSLPPDVQTALTKTAPGTGSHQRAMGVFNDALSRYTQNRLDTMRAYGAKTAPSPYAIE